MSTIASLWLLYEELNRRFFSGACQVARVAFARFAGADEGEGRVTFGMYDPKSRTIYVNLFFGRMALRGLFLVEMELVLFHEMVHAARMNALEPVRFGRDGRCSGDHGPEFTKLYEQHPRHAEFDVDYVSDRVAEWMQINPVEKKESK